jgi:uncharacterized lipoprotein YddW (UPF0748 family)
MNAAAHTRAYSTHTLVALTLCALTAAVAAHVVPVHAAGTSDEVRALWVRRASLDSEAAIRKMVASATTAGFNTLFVQAINEELPLRSPSILSVRRSARRTPPDFACTRGST